MFSLAHDCWLKSYSTRRAKFWHLRFGLCTSSINLLTELYRNARKSLPHKVTFRKKISIYIYIYVCVCVCGLGSSVGIPTELRAGRSGIDSRWGRDFPPVQTGPGAHPASCKMGAKSFPGVKCDRGVLLTTYPCPVPRPWKSTAIPLPTLWATPGL